MSRGGDNHVICAHILAVNSGTGKTAVPKAESPPCRKKRDKDGSPSRLPMHDQDHAGSENGDVAVVAFEGGDGGSIGVGDGVESFATLHFVVNHCGGIFVHG